MELRGVVACCKLQDRMLGRGEGVEAGVALSLCAPSGLLCCNSGNCKWAGAKTEKNLGERIGGEGLGREGKTEKREKEKKTNVQQLWQRRGATTPTFPAEGSLSKTRPRTRAG